MYSCDVCGLKNARLNDYKKHNITMKHRRNMEKSQSETKQYESLSKHDPQLERYNFLLEQILQLQKKNAEETPKPANVNYNIAVNKLEPLTDEKMTEDVDCLSIEHIIKGAKGFADFAATYPLKNRIVCTDVARKKFRYKNSTGNIINDVQGRQLTQQMFQGTATKCRELIDIEYDRLQKQVQEIAENGNAGNSDLIEILAKSSHLQEIRRSCTEAAKGENNDFTKEFVSHLAKIC